MQKVWPLPRRFMVTQLRWSDSLAFVNKYISYQGYDSSAEGGASSAFFGVSSWAVVNISEAILVDPRSLDVSSTWNYL